MPDSEKTPDSVSGGEVDVLTDLRTTPTGEQLRMMDSVPSDASQSTCAQSSDGEHTRLPTVSRLLFIWPLMFLIALQSSICDEQNAKPVKRREKVYTQSIAKVWTGNKIFCVAESRTARAEET